MDAPDPLLALDLQLFATGTGLKLYSLRNDWVAMVDDEAGRKRYRGYGSRPWLAVHQCFINYRNRTDGVPL